MWATWKYMRVERYLTLVVIYSSFNTLSCSRLKLCNEGDTLSSLLRYSRKPHTCVNGPHRETLVRSNKYRCEWIKPSNQSSKACKLALFSSWCKKNLQLLYSHKSRSLNFKPFDLKSVLWCGALKTSCFLAPYWWGYVVVCLSSGVQHHYVSAHGQSEHVQQIKDILNEGWPSASLPLLRIIRLQLWTSANLLLLSPDGLLLLLQLPPHLLLEPLAALLVLWHRQPHIAQLVQQLVDNEQSGISMETWENTFSKQTVWMATDRHTPRSFRTCVGPWCYAALTPISYPTTTQEFPQFKTMSLHLKVCSLLPHWPVSSSVVLICGWRAPAAPCSCRGLPQAATGRGWKISPAWRSDSGSLPTSENTRAFLNKQKKNNPPSHVKIIRAHWQFHTLRAWMFRE